MKRLSSTPAPFTTQTTRSFQQTPTQPPNTVFNEQTLAHWQTLWNALPHEIAQKIVWYRAPPPGPSRERALAQRTELLYTLLVNRKLCQAALPLFRLVRWADEYAKYWPEPQEPQEPNAPIPPAPDIEVLVGNPQANLPGGTIGLTLNLPKEPDGLGRLNLLLSTIRACRCAASAARPSNC